MRTGKYLKLKCDVIVHDIELFKGIIKNHSAILLKTGCSLKTVHIVDLA